MQVKEKYLLLSLLLFLSRDVSAINTLSVTSTIEPSSCTVELTPHTVPLGNIDPTTIVAGDHKLFSGAADHEVTVNTKCPVLGTGTPVITLSGTELSTAEPKLFRDSSSSSQGFGIGIAPIAAPGVAPEWTKLVGNGDHFTATPGTNQTVAVAVGCGSSLDCAANSLMAGSLNATVVFTFAYH